MASKIRLKISHKTLTRKDKLKALKQQDRERVPPPKGRKSRSGR